MSYLDFYKLNSLLIQAWFTYVVGVKHIGGNMFERIPKGDAILMKVSFGFNLHANAHP